MTHRWLSHPWRGLACALSVMLAACGGGGDGAALPGSCTVASQQSWLRSYMNDWYFWYRLGPNPSPAGYATVGDYFYALLYGGGDPVPNGGGALWPADRYSYYQSTTSFNQFWSAGETFGYGLAVNGLEAVAQNATRLYVRYIEPGSPAAAAGLVRGDEVLAINGVGALSLIDDVRNDRFTALSASRSGDSVAVDLRHADGSTGRVTLAAAAYALAPVQGDQVLLSPNGRKLGYVFVKDMVDQVESPPPGGKSLATVMNGFRNQGVQEIVLDLRYNGGGKVEVGAGIASYVAGSSRSGQTYAKLLYNDRKAAVFNKSFLFSNPGVWTGFNRVYVLMGERTCSASEQVINGLLGVGVNVVGVGGTSCGKPVGFLPEDDACGTTYSVVNFESVNRLDQGRYFDGLAPNCAVAEDFSRPIGDLADPLLVTAAHHVDNGVCPAGTARSEQPQARTSVVRKRYSGADGGERVGMTVR